MTWVLSLTSLHEGSLNANEMSPENLARLKEAMEKEDYDPIVVSPVSVYYGKTEKLSNSSFLMRHPDLSGYVICDGQWRYRTAKELGWSTINCDVVDFTEGRALPHFYQRQTIQGVMNPLKEAALFWYEMHINDKSRRQVAEEYNVKPNYIKGRMKLLNVSADVVKLYSQGKLNFTHLRELSLLPKEQQIEVALNVIEKKWTTADLLAEIRRLKDIAGTRQDHAYLPAPDEQPPDRSDETTKPKRGRPLGSKNKVDPKPMTLVTGAELVTGEDLSKWPIGKPVFIKEGKVYKAVTTEVEVYVEHLDKVIKKAYDLTLTPNNAKQTLDEVYKLADEEGLDLFGGTARFDNNKPVTLDEHLYLRLKQATKRFFEKGEQSALKEIIMRGLQLNIRAEMMEDE